MKKLKILSMTGLSVGMCLALFAQEPQGRGGQGAPAPGGAVTPAAGAAARGGQVEFLSNN